MPPSEPTVFSELDWNEDAIKDVQALGNKASPMSIYCASKSLAEKGILYLNIILLISPLLHVFGKQVLGSFTRNTSHRLNGI